MARFGERELLEQTTLPFPLHWWDGHAGLGTRTMCRKQLNLVRTACDLVCEHGYLDAVYEALPVWGSTAEGRPATTWLGLYSAISKAHRRALVGTIAAVPNAELRSWFHNNDGDALRLLSWHTTYVWLEAVFQAHFFAAVAGDAQGVFVGNPSGYAIGHADAAIVMLDQPEPHDVMHWSMLGQARAARTAHVDPPPWSL